MERLPELTPHHRVVLELSELQLPTLSRGTTSPSTRTSPPTTSTATAPSRRTAPSSGGSRSWCPAGGALVLNDEDPGEPAYCDAPAGARDVRYRRRRRRRGCGRRRWLDRRGRACARLCAGRWRAATGRCRILPLAEIPLPGEHNVSNVLAAVAVGLLFGVAPDGHPPRPWRPSRAWSTGWSWWPTVDGVRYVNDSQGTQPDAVIAAVRSLPGAARAHRRRPRQGRPHRRAGRAWSRSGSLPRCSSARAAPELGEAFSAAAGLRRVERATHGGRGRAAPPASRRADGARHRVLLSPAAASFDMFADYAARGAAFKAAVAAVAAEAVERPPAWPSPRRPRGPGARRRGTAMTDALRFPWDGDPEAQRARGRTERLPAAPGRGSASQGRSHASGRSPRPTGDEHRPPASRTARESPRRPRATPGAPRPRLPRAGRDRIAGRVVKGPRRERHEPDYLVLVAVVALAAIGILMVYSSTGVETGPRRQRLRRGRAAARRGPSLGGIGAAGRDAHRLPLLAAFSVLGLVWPWACWCWSCVLGHPSAASADRGHGARALAADRAAARLPPGGVRQAGARRLPGPLDGRRGARRSAVVPHGHAAVPAHRRPDRHPGRAWSPTWAPPACSS